jgi:benzodiazapine receptor|tara:strand:+ start:298 stop:762 length:465 start_codon:yes stop_codon:yes gene_type:complete
MEYLKYTIIFIPLILGSIIASFSNFKKDKEYNKLNKSKVMPPSYIFSIVWPILYLLIGISYYYGINTNSYYNYIIPIIGLIINYSYTPIFLKLDNLILGLVIVLLTLVFAIITFIQFYYFNKMSSYLLIPYILWLTFASYLSYDIYTINKKNNE